MTDEAGAVLAQPGGVGVAQPVRPQPRDAGGFADLEYDLGDAGGGQPATALADPQRPGLAAAGVEPGVEPLAGFRRQRGPA